MVDSGKENDSGRNCSLKMVLECSSRKPDYGSCVLSRGRLLVETWKLSDLLVDSGKENYSGWNCRCKSGVGMLLLVCCLRSLCLSHFLLAFFVAREAGSSSSSSRRHRHGSDLFPSKTSPDLRFRILFFYREGGKKKQNKTKLVRNRKCDFL